MKKRTVKLESNLNKDWSVIYTITTLFINKTSRLEEVCNYDRTTTPGWYRTLEKAKECVDKNWGGLSDDGYYNHLVIEAVSEGLYNLQCLDPIGKQNEWWYKWNSENNKWDPCKKPKSLRMVCQFWS